VTVGAARRLDDSGATEGVARGLADSGATVGAARGLTDSGATGTYIVPKSKNTILFESREKKGGRLQPPSFQLSSRATS